MMRPSRYYGPGLGEGRIDDVVIIQIVHTGGTQEQKRALYRDLADRLHDRLSLRENELIVTIVENTHANWSIGDDQALDHDRNV
jgi:hypothetical protein